MSGSQKFIARNRAPRVQIEYDVELYGAQKKVQLPFVMGVMSDLSGTSEQPSVDQRSFLDIDVDNFDDRMRAMAPRAQFTVPNTLTGEGALAVDLTFEKMDDFSPTAIAAKVETLAPLLEARRQLSDLMAYMDGKAGAETLIETILTQPDLLSALSGASEERVDMDAALDSLRARLPETPEPEDDTAQTLAALAAKAPEPPAEGDSVADVLSGLQPAPEVETHDAHEDGLAALRAVPVKEVAEDDVTEDILGALAEAAPQDAPEADVAGEVLSGIERVEQVAETDTAAEVLAGLEPVVEDAPEADVAGEVLSGIERVEQVAETDTAAEVLAGLEPVAEDAPEADVAGAVLSGIERVEQVAETDTAAEVLAGLEPVAEDAPEADVAGAVLSGIERVEQVAETDTAAEVLAGLEPVVEDAPEADVAGAVLAELPPVVEDAAVADDLDDILAGLEAPDEERASEEALEDVLASLPDAPHDPGTDDLGDVLAGVAPVADDERQDEQSLEDVLEGLEAVGETQVSSDANLEEILAEVADVVPETPVAVAVDEVLAEAKADDLDALLDDLEPATDGEVAPEAETLGDDLDALLTGLEPSAEEAVPELEAEEDDLDALLAGLDEDAAEVAPEVVAGGDGDDLDALMAGLDEDAAEVAPDVVAGGDEDDLDALMAGLDEDGAEVAPEVVAGGDGDDLDALMAGLDEDVADAEPEDVADVDGGDDLDALMAGLDEDLVETAPEVAEAEDDLDALLAGLNEDAPEAALEEATVGEADDLDALLADLGTEEPVAEEANSGAGDDLEALLAEVEGSESAPQLPFGTVTIARPQREDLHRPKFRMAVFGDFTGRSARGVLEAGDGLAGRVPILLDVDTVEEIIEGFGTTLTLPLGQDGAGLDVKLTGLDDLHPDELYEKLEIFEALSGLRQQLGTGAMAEKAREQLTAWGQAHGTPIVLPKRSASTSIPANRKLSDFQALIGDTGGQLSQASAADDLIARIVGPHIVKAPDAGAAAMMDAVDAALSSAMRMVLHHPEFQAVEAQWRSLDLLARRIETDSSLEIVLYDVSAEELAVDLAAQEDLSQSGLFRLLTAPLDPEEGAGGFSALCGLYTFEETPPHAELLARVAQVAAHVDAPFFAAMTPGYLETAKEDRHPLVAEAWDALRAMPEAGYVGLASPRFLLRLPYGAKTEPCYEFAFEEFTPQEGLSGMLWANPVVLVAILLAGTYTKDGKAMDLGSMMSLGDLPFHYVTDRFGDQVALPCTERNLTTEPAQQTLARGFMPVVWIKGRNEVRLGSFRALGGEDILGPWSGVVPPPRKAPDTPVADVSVTLGGAAPASEAAPAQADAQPEQAESEDESLDDLLAGFDDDGTVGAEDDGMDPELAALLEGL